MKRKPLYQDINLFRVGARVDICDFPHLQNVEIVNINECGVAVKGQLIGPYYVISGRSPARNATQVPPTKIKHAKKIKKTTGKSKARGEKVQKAR